MRTSVILTIVFQLSLVLSQSDDSQNEINQSVVVVNSDQSDEKPGLSVKQVITEPPVMKTYTKPTTIPIYSILPVQSRYLRPSDNSQFSDPSRRPVYYDLNRRLEPLDNSQYPDLARRPVYYDSNSRAIYPEPSGRPNVVYTRPTYPEPFGGPDNIDSYGRRVYYYDQDPDYRRNTIDNVPDRYSNRNRERISDRHHHDESGSDESESDDSSDE